MSLYLYLVLPLAVLFFPLGSLSKRCYVGVSSPDAINGVYAPYHADSFKIINDNGEFGSYTIQKSPQDNNDFYFFKDGVKILTKAFLTYDSAISCIEDKTNVLSAWPKTYAYPLPRPMSGPFLGEIVNPTKTKVTTKDTYQSCFNWVRGQTDATMGAATAVNWSYNDTCTAVWGGQPANRIEELPSRTSSTATKNHMRAQLLKPIPAPGTTSERRLIGSAVTIHKCAERAKERGDAVTYVTVKAGKCYQSTDDTAEVHQQESPWMYLRVDFPKKKVDVARTFSCAVNP